MTGYVTVWHGSLPLGPVLWLPWSLWAVHSAVKNPAGLGGLWVALITGLMLLTGHPGVGGLVLLTTGLYFVWILADDFFFGDLPVRRQWRLAAWRVAVVAAGWLIGFLIGTPYLLPLLEYGRTGYRMDVRSTGFEERPPEGLEGIPAILWPEFNGGETHATTTRITQRSSLIEGASAAYAGLLAALWLAPLAWRHRRLRSLTVFLALLTLVSLGWTLNVPGIVHLLRSEWMRPLASLSFNRWAFAASDAILILAAIGLDSLLASVPQFRLWWRFPQLLCAGFGCWCLYRFATLSPAHTRQGFETVFLLGACMSLAGIAGWATTFSHRPRIGWLRIGLIGLLPLELFWFAWTERRQADISLNFPPVAVLDKLTTLPPGRIWGLACVEPNLNQTFGMEDIRGYDGVDPGNFIRLFELAVNPSQTMFYFYARTQMAIPAAAHTDQGLQLHPVTDLLNVRYLIFRSRPPISLPIVLHEDDYWVSENVRALPRAYVPRSVRVVRDDDEALAQMGSYDFDPRQTAFVTDDLRLPARMQGQATVQYPNPSRAEIDASMQTDGLVLVSDLWDGGCARNSTARSVRFTASTRPSADSTCRPANITSSARTSLSACGPAFGRRSAGCCCCCCGSFGRAARAFRTVSRASAQRATQIREPSSRHQESSSPPTNGLRRSIKTVSRQTPRSRPMRSRLPISRKPHARCRRRLAAFSANVAPCKVQMPRRSDSAISASNNW